MTTAGGQTLSYTYDALKRHTATTVTKNGSTIFRVAKAYYNHATDSTRTTAQVQYYNVRNSAGTLIAGSQYVYDKLGNIKQIKESESPFRVLVEYDYDDLNQLVSEEIYTYTGTSTTPSKTTVNTFTYDTAGNLLKVYENGVEKDEYTYLDNDWQDLLTKFNGTTINYDASGNPLNWYNGNTYTDLTWTMGRQLESLTMETDTENIGVSYTYDMSGMRSSKTVVYGVGEAHSHEYTSSVTAPTCTTAGYTTYTCDCGESYVDNLVDALGHNYVQSGNVYTCSRCGDSYTGHEHSYTEETTQPTCTTAGYTVYTCSCGDSYTVDIPALGHNYVLVGQSGNVATYECSRCGHRYTAVIPVDPNPPVEYSLRSSNTVTEHHEYVYMSGLLMRETITTTSGTNVTTQVLDIAYDINGTPIALTVTTGSAAPVTYYYVTNMPGDVLCLVNSAGTVVARYEYDAWGRTISATGSMADVNPLRYRGYYYDQETGLYYLQSRYYDPAVRRFINADSVSTTSRGFLGYNMFAYCGNNPITRTDESGESWWGWVAAVAVVAICAVAVVATAGGAAAAITAVTAVVNGCAAATTASTIAAGAFVGASTGFAVGTAIAVGDSSDLEDFEAYGEVVAATTLTGAVEGMIGASALKPGSCFVAGTPVHTVDGCQPIESIETGDYVWAWDEETGEVALKEVVETYVSEANELVHISVGGSEIVATTNHPFYSPVKGWTAAVHLRAGDILVLVNGEYVVVEQVQHEILERPVKVYNFQVVDYHTYYVADAGVLVHNKCNDKPTSPGNMQRQVERGQAPKDVDMVHDAHLSNVPNQQPHVHFKDGTAMNMDGTIHDAKGGIPKITRAIAKWLQKNGWAYEVVLKDK